ncbi:HNH endonuclease signature motif containing protein [Gordonia defluvii]
MLVIVDPSVEIALPIDLDGAMAAALREAAGEPFVIPDEGDDPGFDGADTHLADTDTGVWQDRAHALDAAMAVTVGEPAWTLDTLTDAAKATALIAWTEYREIGAMHTYLAKHGKPEPSARGVRMLDIEMQCAARVAMSQGLAQHQAEKWLSEAIAMRDRLPRVGHQLRTATITPRQFRLIVARTELIDEQQWAPQTDAAIAAVLARRAGAGTWSAKRLTDMVDRIIFRHDPDAVRRRRNKATDARSAWIVPGADGMATLGATMTAENAAIAYTTVRSLAELVCPADPRCPDARTSDALFALVTGTAFECDCHQPACTAAIPTPDTLTAWLRERQDTAVANGRVLVHVIADQATIDGRHDEPAFMDGHGVISAAHLRELLDRDDVRVRPLHPRAHPADPTPMSLPTHLASDPYRTSTALDTYIRTRDGYCTIPGCDQPAWHCDIDHVEEYDHTNPTTGGQTTADALSTKCRLHHNLKTSDNGWLDDQYRDHTGRLISEVISPEGIHFPGPAETNTVLFPALETITWHTPRPDTTPPPAQRITRTRNRTKAKHARRRAERATNRRLRLAHESDGDPPF